jgi:hypothetical protein
MIITIRSKCKKIQLICENRMVIQIAGVVGIPIIMLILAASPFDEPIKIEPSGPVPSENIDNRDGTFLIFWVIWLIILIRIVYQVRKGNFRIKKGF